MTQQVRVLTYFGFLWRRRRQPQQVAHFVQRGQEALARVQMPEYTAAHGAHLAWLAWQRGDLDGAEANGKDALAGWARSAMQFPFQWAASWPLLAVALARQDRSGAVVHGRAILHPSQQRLPSGIADLLTAAVHAWEQGQEQAAGAALDQAVHEAEELGRF